MGMFYRKPFFLCCFFVILGACLATFTNAKIVKLSLLAALCLSVIMFVAYVISKRKALLFSFVLPLLFAVVSAVYFFSYADNKTEMVRKYEDDKPHEIEAVVTKCTYLSNYLSVYDANCSLIDGERIKTKIIIEASFYLELEVGDKIRTSALFTEVESEHKQYYNSKGIYLLAEMISGEYEKIGVQKDFLLTLSILRNALTRVVYEKTEDDEAAGLICAVFLGDRDGLTLGAKRDFKRIGGYHLLALSGMHLSVFCAALDVLLKFFRLRKGKRYIVLTLVMAFYVALTGFQLSMVRSAIMLFATYTGYYLRSRRDSLTSLAFAAAIIIVFSPSSVSDVGLWMSVAATFGIILAIPLEVFVRFKLRRIRNKALRKAVSYVASAIIFSVVATLMVFPFSCFVFRAVSLVGPLTTLLLSGAVSFTLVIAPIGLLTSWIPFVSDFVFFIGSIGAEFILWVSEMLSGLENIYVSLDYEFVPYVTIPFFAILFLLLMVRIKRKWIIPAFAVLWIAAFAVLEFFAINSETLILEYTNLGKNEYFSVSYCGRNALVDISDGSYAKMSEASGEATSKGYCELDAVILTHLHNRHIISLKKLSSAYILRSVYLPEPETVQETEIAREIENAMDIVNVDIYYYGQNDCIDVNGVKLDIERAYLKRSSHPVVGIGFSGRPDLKYYGSSYSEYGEITSCENVIFGIHGPVYKKEFAIDASKCSLISFASSDAFLGCTVNDNGNVKIVKEPEKLVFKYD